LVVLLVLGLLLAKESRAQQDTPRAPPSEPTRSLWQPAWPTFGGIEAVATVSAGLGTAVLFLIEPPQDPRWEGGVLFDDAVRRNLRLDSARGRQRVRSAGDLPYFAAPLLPLIVDPLIVAWLVRGDTKAAVNLELVGLEAFSYVGLLSFISTRVSLRERPDSSECRRTHTDDSACGDVDTEAFWSGHTSIAAASAGLVCANHQYLSLWGHPVADASACIVATTGAVWTGVSRLLADRHYTTDVVAGLAVGFGIGYSVPVLLHYQRRRSEVALTLEPGPLCDGGCLTLRGSF
jgi:membrane-associated phospholipid phosphatase